MTADAATDDQRLGFLTGRYDAIDAARGGAIVAMISYHFAWDLSYLRLIATPVAIHPVWRLYAHVIAGSFLFLVGVGLALAHGRGFRPDAFVRRLAIIGGAALLVTIGTYFAFPDAYIFFGILHCIAAASVIALPFVYAPAWLTLVVAALVVAAPSVMASPAFDAPLLAFLGLGTRVPVTNDYVPLFPWAGLVLAGVALGRAAAAWLAGGAGPRWRADGLVGSSLVWAGRHSLPIYLLHQLVLLGALTALLQITGPNPAAVEAGFTRDCETSCSAVRDPATCRAACACTVGRLKESGLWAKLASSTLDADETARMSGFARQCLAKPATQP
jgi:uncharacterized membrane protein